MDGPPLSANVNPNLSVTPVSNSVFLTEIRRWECSVLLLVQHEHVRILLLDFGRFSREGEIGATLILTNPLGELPILIANSYLIAISMEVIFPNSPLLLGEINLWGW
jgi:hypothetical protein